MLNEVILNFRVFGYIPCSIAPDLEEVGYFNEVNEWIGTRDRAVANAT